MTAVRRRLFRWILIPVPPAGVCPKKLSYSLVGYLGTAAVRVSIAAAGVARKRQRIQKEPTVYISAATRQPAAVSRHAYITR